MWLFTRRKSEPAPDLTLAARIDELEKRVDAIDVEWSEWFDKYRRLYARLAKRVHDESEKPDAPEKPHNGTLGRGPINPLAAALLRRPGPPGGP